MSPREEMAFVKGACDHDEASITALVRHFEPMLRAEALRWRGPHADQDDLFQEACLTIVPAAEHWSPDGGEFAGYLRVCARNRMHRVVAHGQRRPDQPLTVEDPDGALTALTTMAGADWAADPFEFLAARETLETRCARARQLSPLTRRIFAAYLSGLSYRQIEEALGLSYRQVDRHLDRARALVMRGRRRDGSLLTDAEVAA